jgi:hypothetical protein
VTASPAEPQAQVIDLFEALKRSLAEHKAPAGPEAEDQAAPPTERTPAAPPLAKTRERRASARKKQAAS